MGCIAHPLGHLLRRFELHIHITGSGLYGSDEPALGDLHRLHLAALRRHGLILERRLRTHHICNAAGRHKRHIGCEHILNLPGRQVASVQADLRHLTLLQSLKYLLCRLVLYSRTNHILVVLSGVFMPRGQPPPPLSCRGSPRHLLHAAGRNAPCRPPPSCPCPSRPPSRARRMDS